MTLHQKDVQLFAKAALDTFDLKKFSIDKEKALNELKHDIVSEFEDLNSDQTKKARHDYFKVKDVDSEDYAERVYILDDGLKLIYGIRHMGGEPRPSFYSIESKFQIII